MGHVEWVDFIPVKRLPRPGEVVHASGTFARAAGGGGVVAGVLAELGAEVDFFTALGEDSHGHAAADQLAARRCERPRGVAGGRADAPGGDDARVHAASGRSSRSGSGSSRGATIRCPGMRSPTRGRSTSPPATRRRSRTPGRRASAVASPRGRAAIEHAEGRPVDALIFSAGDRDESHWAGRLAGALPAARRDPRRPRRRVAGRVRGQLAGGGAAGSAARLLRLRGLVRGRLHVRSGSRRVGRRRRRAGRRVRCALPDARRRAVTASLGAHGILGVRTPASESATAAPARWLRPTRSPRSTRRSRSAST